MAYSQKVIDHYENPRNVGKLNENDEDVGTGMVGAPACGDVMRLQIRVSPDGIIEDAKFKTYGCGSAIASSSLLTEWVRGKSLDEAGAIRNTEIAQELSLPPVKIHCSVLAEDAIKAAIKNYRDKIWNGSLGQVEILRGPQGLNFGADAGGIIALSSQTNEEGLNTSLEAQSGKFGTSQGNLNISGSNGSSDFSIFASQINTNMEKS